LFDEGAGDLDSAAFQKALEDASVSMSFSAGRDEFYGSLKTLTVNRDEAFRLLKLGVNEPRFDAEPVERIRSQIVAGLKQDRTDPETLAFDLWYETAFPDHAYGRRKEGTEESLARITADDLRVLRNNVFARAGLKIAVVGDIDAATLAPILDDVFGALPAESTLVETAEAMPLAAARRDEAMAIPQTVIRFGTGGLKRADPDFIPAYILNHILGGGSFTSRLYNEVREKRGLAYSVYTLLAPYEHSAIFLGGVATRADRAEAALALIRAEIKRIAEDGPTEEELE
ncbi:MAG: insulinase family protein, partial [Hyphomicrobiales bacterium]|nr:insulinase family protein [Hyphomicrobiales bacterium]